LTVAFHDLSRRIRGGYAGFADTGRLVRGLNLFGGSSDKLIAEEPLQRTCKIVAAYRLLSERIFKLPDPAVYSILHI